MAAGPLTWRIRPACAALDSVESIGIERSRREQEQADLILLVLDRSVPLQAIDRELIATNSEAILAANKSDRVPAWYAGDLSLQSRAIVTVSAETGDGLPGLIEMISRRLVPERPAHGEAVPFRTDQVDQLRQLRASLLSDDRAAGARQLVEMVRGRKRDDR